MNIIDSVIATAKTQLGVREATGHNDGPDVEKYLAAVGVGAKSGQPWCAAFVFWVLDTAGVKVWPKEAYCPSLWTWAKTHGILHGGNTAGMPKRGDVFLLLDAPGPNGAYHTGIVLDVNKARGVVATCEGNTDRAGSPEGQGVYVRERRIYDCDFIRWADLPGQVGHGSMTGKAGDAALTVKLDTGNGFQLIECDAVNEAGRIRGNVSDLARALGYQVRWIPPGRVELFRPQPTVIKP